MLKIIASSIIGVMLGIVINLVSNYFLPTVAQNKRIIVSSLVGLIVLSILIVQIPDSAEQSIASFVDGRLLSSSWAWLYIALFVLFLLFASRYIIKKLHVFFTISPPDEQEKAYLESFIRDLEHRNQQTRWSDKYYVDTDTELRERVADFEIPPFFYLVKPFDKDFKKQDYNNLTNVEKIDSSRGTTFKSLGTALSRAADNAVVVISPPGGGKTVSLRNLAIKLAKQRIKGRDSNLAYFY